MSSRTFRRVAVAGAAFILAGTLSGCSFIDGLLGGSSETRDESGAIVEGGETSAFSIKVGDCYLSADLAESIDTIPTVPCSEEHDAEVFFEHEMPDGPYPGDTEISDAGYAACGAEFESFLGGAWDETMPYDMGIISPSMESWTQGDDRLINCVAFEIDLDTYEAVPRTGSLKDIINQ